MDRAQDRAGAETIGFLLAPGFSALAFFSALEPLRVANRLSGRGLFVWRVYSEDGEAVEASNGMRIVVDAVFGAESPPTLIVCSGFEPARSESRKALATLRQFSRAGVMLGALDTGAHILAKAGLLDGVRVSMHWEAAPAFREEFPHIEVTGELFEVEKRIFTCAGGTAALDLMLDRIGRQHGPALAAAVSEQFIHDRIRSSRDHQRMELSTRLKVTNSKVLSAVALMERHLEQPLDPGALARQTGVTSRQLERLFNAALGVSPQRYYRDLRLMRARHLLRQTDMPVLDIAVATGFTSGSALSRSYRDRFGASPSRDRREGAP
ncbi:MAG TPA: GlxA family transcriptional regulator [Caulobacteraceae bacterium]|jgi:AraC family carnitine catabolism transcriptional activator